MTARGSDVRLGRRLAMLLAPAALLGACAGRPPPAATNTEAAPPPAHWTEDSLIEHNQLLPNGLRPFRYYDW